MLAIFEKIAAEQPIGASTLAQQLGMDKSAVQRSLVTLANAGWIAQTPTRPVQWELSAHLFTLAQLPHSSDELRARARKVLEELRDETGETAFLAISDIGRFVVIDVVESHHMLRMVPRVGTIIPASGSATGRILLPYFDAERQETLLGRPPSAGELAQFAASRERGYGLSEGEVMEGSTTIAAPVLDARGLPAAAVVITGPSERISPDRHKAVGEAVARYAAKLSSRIPAKQTA